MALTQNFKNSASDKYIEYKLTDFYLSVLCVPLKTY